MAKDLAVVLSDASVESAVAAGLAGQRHRLGMVHVAGEGPAGERRRRAFEGQVEFFKPEKVWVVPGGGQLDWEKGAVPGFVDLLPGVASALKAAAIWKGTWVYHPLRTGSVTEELARGTEFVQIWNEMIQMPCGREMIEVTAPLLELDPWQVIDLGFQIGAPFEQTWSCDGGGEGPCNKCLGCHARNAAFQRAAKGDPLQARR